MFSLEDDNLVSPEDCADYFEEPENATERTIHGLVQGSGVLPARDRALHPLRPSGAEEEEEESARGGAGDEAALTGQQAGLFRGVAARALYLSLDRPELAFAAKELCRRMSSPCKGDLRGLRRICQYLLSAPREVYQFKWQPIGLPIRVYCGTDFAGCHLTRKSTSGGARTYGRQDRRMHFL